MKRLLLIAAAAVLWLSGCANPIQQADISKVENIPLDHGFVGVTVVNNTDRLATLHDGWTEVLIVRLDNVEQKKQAAIAAARAKGSKKPDEQIDWDLDIYSMRPIAAGAIQSQMFVGSMPPGEYWIASLYSYYYDGNVTSTLSMPVRFQGGMFTVATNTFTNLGTLVFQPLKNVTEQSFWTTSGYSRAYVTRSPEQMAIQQFALETYPALRSRLTASEELSWEADAADEMRDGLYALSRQNAYGDRAVRLHQYGKAALLARFGLLHYVDHEGNWQSQNLPTDAQLAAILETPEEVFVGGEFGNVFAASSLAGPWQRLDTVDSRESVVWLGRSAQQSYAVTQSADTFYLYRFQDIRQPWTRVHSIKRNNSVWTGVAQILPMLTPDGRLRVFHGGQQIELNAEGSRASTLKAKQSLVKLAALEAGVLMGLETSLWDGIGDPLVSIDDAKSWKAFNRNLNFIGDQRTESSLPARLDDGRLVMISRSNTPDSEALHLYTSDYANLGDRSRHVRHGKTPENCEILLPEMTHDNTLYLLCDQGGVVRTTDLGASYEVLFGVDVPAMQQSYDRLMESETN